MYTPYLIYLYIYMAYAQATTYQIHGALSMSMFSTSPGRIFATTHINNQLDDTWLAFYLSHHLIGSCCHRINIFVSGIILVGLVLLLSPVSLLILVILSLRSLGNTGLKLLVWVVVVDDSCGRKLEDQLRWSKIFLLLSFVCAAYMFLRLRSLCNTARSQVVGLSCCGEFLVAENSRTISEVIYDISAPLFRFCWIIGQLFPGERRVRDLGVINSLYNLLYGTSLLKDNMMSGKVMVHGG